MVEKLKMQANPMDRVLAKVMEICPAAVQNGKVNFERLKAELADTIDDGKKEAYDFTWVGKRAAIVEANKPIRKTLRPAKSESKNWDTTENLYIEGDNLEVLKLLQESYLNKVKMIYIDPPYNTGKDFVYRDNFTKGKAAYETELGLEDENTGERLFRNTETNGRFHSDWCSMIYPRLKIARDFLTDDGVIFISIDDNEVGNLRKICDEVLGEINFIGILSVENNPKGRKNSDFISVSSEHCVIYAKNKSTAHFIENVPKKASDMTEDEGGNFVHGSGKRVLVGENSFNKYVAKSDSDKNYSVYYRARDKGVRTIKEEYGVIDSQLASDGYIKYYSHNDGRLVENTYTENKFHELFKQDALDFSIDKIYEKNFNDTIRIKSQLVNREYEAIVRGKKQNYSMNLTTTGAGTYIKNLFEVTVSPFSAPKNIGYLKLLISLFESEPFIVLDFFSGSATTADAVMQLNAEDGGKRKFIMVQFPENLDENLQRASEATEKQTIQSAISICDAINKPHHLTEIGKERIRRAGDKIVKDAGLAAQNLDTGFRVLKLDETSMKDVYYAPSELKQQNLLDSVDNIKNDRSPLDLLFGVMVDWGVSLSLPLQECKVGKNTIYIVGDNDLAACFDTNVEPDTIRKIAALKPTRAVFRDASFGRDDAKINMVEIFKATCGWDEKQVDNNVKVI